MWGGLVPPVSMGMVGFLMPAGDKHLSSQFTIPGRELKDIPVAGVTGLPISSWEEIGAAKPPPPIQGAVAAASSSRPQGLCQIRAHTWPGWADP